MSAQDIFFNILRVYAIFFWEVREVTTVLFFERGLINGLVMISARLRKIQLHILHGY